MITYTKKGLTWLELPVGFACGDSFPELKLTKSVKINSDDNNKTDLCEIHIMTTSFIYQWVNLLQIYTGPARNIYCCILCRKLSKKANLLEIFVGQF